MNMHPTPLAVQRSEFGRWIVKRPRNPRQPNPREAWVGIAESFIQALAAVRLAPRVPTPEIIEP